MENRNGLVVDSTLTTATGTAEREATASMLGARPTGGRITVGADKLFDTKDFIAEMVAGAKPRARVDFLLAPTRGGSIQPGCGCSG